MGEMNQTRIVFFHMLFDQSLPPSFGTFFTCPPCGRERTGLATSSGPGEGEPAHVQDRVQS